MAPEVLLGVGHHKAVDYWSLGVLIYEMIAGYPPFYANNHMELYQKICELNYTFTSPNFSEDSVDLIKHLLLPPSKRLGNLAGGVKDIKRHRFFHGVMWEKLEMREIPAPTMPNMNTNSKNGHTRSEMGSAGAASSTLNDLINSFGKVDNDAMDPYEPTFRDFDYEIYINMNDKNN
eukprot:TRINITY_DN4223_c0_g1_i1.p2 TRINITY_DN4223_c0_g1~~TRINITY_DN4223_c0_g1_i1.p2  ORF type:complete len:176 (-),score=42.48 TRINITY_DN4223_c0_g1_i1:324-851(-)